MVPGLSTHFNQQSGFHSNTAPLKKNGMSIIHGLKHNINSVTSTVVMPQMSVIIMTQG